MVTADPCAMPVGYGQTCQLPGDHHHDDGCQLPHPPYSRKPITLPDGTPVIGWSGPATPTRPQRCACGRPVPASSSCGDCCAECDDCTEDGPDPNVCAGCDHQRAFHAPEHDGICLGHCDCIEFEEPA